MQYEVLREELSSLLIYSFRYALGRMTYVPSDVCTLIKKYKDVLNEHDMMKIIKEIDECTNLGMKCDKEVWLELREYLRSKDN